MDTPQITLGFDCFHGDNIPSFHALYTAGIRWCYIKRTQAAGYVDPAGADYYARAREALLLRGAYHFFDPEADPLAQARFFVNTAQPAKGDLIPALDVETEGLNVGANARACADEIKRLTGYCPVLYSSKSFYCEHLAPRFAGFTLWIAEYTGLSTVPELPAGTAFWQNADDLHIPGCPHPLDADMFFGTVADLQKYTIK